MSENGKDWFVVERARALAWVHLTERDDLVIAPAGKDVGLDYLVSLTKKDDKPSLRQFGVILRAARKPVTLNQLDKLLRPTMQSLQRVGEFPYPVCLLYFTMEDNRGYYTWVAEPLLTSDGKPQLQRRAAASCNPLDRPALDRIVSQVSAWYEAFFSSIVVSA
jgi:hypothetical protein